ncbi:MAG: sensor histidine kinase [Acidisphaera sp.]|nr:sensor histidine kinase [Acidisphaera sp.]
MPPLRPPSTVRSRLVALFLLAAAPVCLTAAWIARQNEAMIADRSNALAIAVRDASAARVWTVIERSSDRLSTLSPESLTGCAGLVGGAIAAIAVVAPDGAVRCAAGPDQIQQMLRQAPERPPVVAGENGPVVFVPAPAQGGGTVRAAVRVTLNQDAGPIAALAAPAWLLGADAIPVALTAAAANDRLLPRNLAEIAGRTDPVTAEGLDGEPHAYAAVALTPTVRVLVAAPGEGMVTEARIALLRRLGELALGLVAGIILVAVGASRAVVAPLQRVVDAVRVWRGGGAFDAAQDARAPTELRELTRSFGEATRALADREAQLRSAIAQQDLLMQEIHHRVKNNLQVVASLLNLQASRIRLPEAKAEFQSARDRVRALATLHRHLYAYGEVHTINMRSFLSELCGQLLPAMAPGSDRIAFHIDASELQISSDQAVPMALIVTEAVSNAAKYAFPAGRRGTIRVRLTTDQDVAHLVIEDNGVGIPAGRAETETGIRDGIGLQLIRGFARQLGATLTVTEDQGTRIDVEIRLRRAPAQAGDTPVLVSDPAAERQPTS